MDIIEITKQLSDTVDPLTFGDPVTHVYNPLKYAWKPHLRFLKKYGAGKGRYVMMGMNPGPWGMAQTGIPFGEVALARDWLKVADTVEKPDKEHPKRPVTGFECQRSEVSGARIWGWARDKYKTPEHFFEHFFVVNYCPLSFMEEGGRNRTPDKLQASEREPLLKACDTSLRQIIECLEPQMIIGVGAWAQKCAERVVGDMNIPVGRILHPSPASPAANRGWAEAAEKQLVALGAPVP